MTHRTITVHEPMPVRLEHKTGLLDARGVPLVRYEEPAAREPIGFHLPPRTAAEGWGGLR